ncbi:hypothetical protein DUI87_28731 [Hirundo rustica rustica]|uniref:Uncharacterized protein n=1 Tax=Hirundo rustica rustica TaxID=333673 RepID=A0A3M0J795_HIRRU|nr:hypothetical protein DUI87_28731 [Hirundo rustica rustica]
MDAGAGCRVQILEFGQLKPLLSTSCTINPQIYICWHFARIYTLCVKPILPAYIREVSFCIVLRAYPYASGLERRKSAGSRPAIPYSELRLFVNSQEKKPKNPAIKHNKSLTDGFREKFCEKI